MKSTDPARRSKWVDELLERKEFSEIWVSKWAELLQVALTPPGTSARRQCFSTTTGSSTSSQRTCQWTRWSRSSWCQRRHLQERGDKLLSDHQRNSVLHGHSLRDLPGQPRRHVRWKDVLLDDCPEIHVRRNVSKLNQERFVPMPRVLAKWLRLLKRGDEG